MGSDESHFNVSVGSDGQSHRTVSTNHSLSESKGEPKRYRTEVLPPTSLTPYALPLGQTGSQKRKGLTDDCFYIALVSGVLWSHVVLNELLCFFIVRFDHRNGVRKALCGCYTTGHFIPSHIHRVWLAVTCQLHFPYVQCCFTHVRALVAE